MAGATGQTWAGSQPAGEDARAGARVFGLHARLGELEPGEAVIDRVFDTVSAALDGAGVRFADVDSVVLALDDVADGRSITTMLHATAAGAYFKDEVRVTNGSLTALGLAGLRIQTGLSDLSVVASWWHPSAPKELIARASIGIRDDHIRPPERFDDEPAGAGCVACLVGPPQGTAGLDIEGFAWTQADFRNWLARDGEPAATQARLASSLRDHSASIDPAGVLAASATAPGVDWDAAVEAAGIEDWRRLETSAAHVGVADGLALLSELAPRLEAGEQGIVMATGSPQFLLAEAVCVRRSDA